MVKNYFVIWSWYDWLQCSLYFDIQGPSTVTYIIKVQVIMQLILFNWWQYVFLVTYRFAWMSGILSAGDCSMHVIYIVLMSLSNFTISFNQFLFFTYSTLLISLFWNEIDFMFSCHTCHTNCHSMDPIIKLSILSWILMLCKVLHHNHSFFFLFT